MTAAIIEAQYLPCIAYFCALSKHETIYLEQHAFYEKQTYRNRCYINTARGKQALIIPVITPLRNTRMAEVIIDHSQKWANNHWRAIQSAYGKSPFFEYFSDALHDTLYARHDLLYQLNHSLLTMCLKWLRSGVNIKETTAYEKTPAEGVADLRSVIHPKKPALLKSFYQPAVYYQVFGNNFVDNLSLLDLIFCEGPGAAGIVRASTVK